MAEAAPRLKTIALVGLGHMGMPMAKLLLGAGHRVLGADHAPAARDHLATLGGEPKDHPAKAVANAEVAILMLPDSTVVDTVISELIELEALRPGAVVIDMSSSEPKRSQDNARRLEALDISFLDAPVSGGVRGAKGGTLTIMVGGAAEAVEQVRAVLETFGTVRHVGPAGAGHAVKALNNLISATHLWITSEAISLASRLGVGASEILEVLNGSSGRSGSSETKWPQFILPGTFDSGFAARLMLKDVRIATNLAREMGIPSALGDEVAELWSRATSDLPPDADHTEIARWLATQAEASK